MWQATSPGGVCIDNPILSWPSSAFSKRSVYHPLGSTRALWCHLHFKSSVMGQVHVGSIWLQYHTFPLSLDKSFIQSRRWGTGERKRHLSLSTKGLSLTRESDVSKGHFSSSPSPSGNLWPCFRTGWASSASKINSQRGFDSRMDFALRVEAIPMKLHLLVLISCHHTWNTSQQANRKRRAFSFLWVCVKRTSCGVFGFSICCLLGLNSNAFFWSLITFLLIKPQSHVRFHSASGVLSFL